MRLWIRILIFFSENGNLPDFGNLSAIISNESHDVELATFKFVEDEEHLELQSEDGKEKN